MTNNDTNQPYRDAPEVLYKYRSLSGESLQWAEDIFLNNRLYFPRPDQINDPFDSQIPPILENVTKQMILDYLDGLKVADSDDAGKIVIAKHNVENNDIETLRIVLRMKYNEGHLQNVGLLSLSANKTDIRMWSHYSDSHKGICIGFNFSKLLFFFNGRYLCATTVEYPMNNQYPRWDYLDNDGVKIAHKLYFSKSECWIYEQEWRIVFPEKGNTPQSFDPDALISVHLGCRISNEHKGIVVKWCSCRKHKPKIFQMTKDEYSYLLKEEEIIY